VRQVAEVSAGDFEEGVEEMRKIGGLIAVGVAALAITSSALAFDCIRVSSSAQALQQSSDKSGNWLYFDMTTNGVATLFDFFEVSASPGQIACVRAAYLASSAPKYFALGIGVASANGSGKGPDVLAHNAPDSTLSNGTGIDHLEESVVPVLLSAFPGCGIPLPPG
jgi:hypothetical protein